MSNHTGCVWNCGSTDCPASTGNYHVDRYRDAIKKIIAQPFFNAARKTKEILENKT